MSAEIRRRKVRENAMRTLSGEFADKPHTPPVSLEKGAPESYDSSKAGLWVDELLDRVTLSKSTTDGVGGVNADKRPSGTPSHKDTYPYSSWYTEISEHNNELLLKKIRNHPQYQRIKVYSMALKATEEMKLRNLRTEMEELAYRTQSASGKPIADSEKSLVEDQISINEDDTVEATAVNVEQPAVPDPKTQDFPKIGFKPSRATQLLPAANVQDKGATGPVGDDTNLYRILPNEETAKREVEILSEDLKGVKNIVWSQEFCKNLSDLEIVSDTRPNENIDTEDLEDTRPGPAKADGDKSQEAPAGRGINIEVNSSQSATGATKSDKRQSMEINVVNPFSGGGAEESHGGRAGSGEAMQPAGEIREQSTENIRATQEARTALHDQNWMISRDGFNPPNIEKPVVGFRMKPDARKSWLGRLFGGMLGFQTVYVYRDADKLNPDNSASAQETPAVEGSPQSHSRETQEVPVVKSRKGVLESAKDWLGSIFKKEETPEHKRTTRESQVVQWEASVRAESRPVSNQERTFARESRPATAENKSGSRLHPLNARQNRAPSQTELHEPDADIPAESSDPRIRSMMTGYEAAKSLRAEVANARQWAKRKYGSRKLLYGMTNSGLSFLDWLLMGTQRTIKHALDRELEGQD